MLETCHALPPLCIRPLCWIPSLYQVTGPEFRPLYHQHQLRRRCNHRRVPMSLRQNGLCRFRVSTVVIPCITGLRFAAAESRGVFPETEEEGDPLANDPPECATNSQLVRPWCPRGRTALLWGPKSLVAPDTRESS